MTDIIICQDDHPPEIFNSPISVVDLEKLVPSLTMLHYPNYLQSGKAKSLKLVVDGNASNKALPRRWPAGSSHLGVNLRRFDAPVGETDAALTRVTRNDLQVISPLVYNSANQR